MVRNIRKTYTFYSISKNKAAGRVFLCPLFFSLPAVLSRVEIIMEV